MFGLVNVTQTVAQARDFGGVLSRFFIQQGLAAYSNLRAAEVAGALLTASSVLCLVLAIGFSVPRLRQRRRASWIPLVCAAMSVVATLAIVTGAVTADPAFAAYLRART